jgi:hypothetical protein
MEIMTKAAWAGLALIHASPAATVFAPSLIKRLYGVDGTGDLGVLLLHRGALFLAVVAACLFGMFDPASRRAVSAVVAISVVCFLLTYLRAGSPPGALRTIALVDLAGLVPLGWVLFTAWRPHAA